MIILIITRRNTTRHYICGGHHLRGLLLWCVGATASIQLIVIENYKETMSINNQIETQLDTTYVAGIICVICFSGALEQRTRYSL